MLEGVLAFQRRRAGELCRLADRLDDAQASRRVELFQSAAWRNAVLTARNR